MSKKLFYLLGIAVTIILGTILYLKFCCSCCVPTKTTDNTTNIVKTPERNQTPFFLDGSGINYQCNDNFNFLQNNSALLEPISDSISIGVEALKDVLLENPNQKITITGYAMSNEENATKFENLGLARANDVKTFFVSKGLAESQFDTKGELVDSWQILGDTLSGPVKFIFSTSAASNSTDLDLLRDKINKSPLVLYFNTNQSNNKLSTLENQKISDIISYTKQVPDARVLIVGHSDNVGNRDANTVLAQKRADFTKDYLIKNGIEASRIETQSQGPDAPAADNNTAAGMAKNRRTVITIK